MRSFRTACCLSVIFVAVTVSLAEITERDAAKLAKEFVSSKTDDKRRGAILNELRDADPLLLQKTLKKTVKDEEERAPSLALAHEMGVPGLTDSAWKYLEEHEGICLDYLVKMQEGDTVGKLIDMWAAGSPDQGRFKALEERFQSHWLPLAQLAKFRDKLNDESRGPSALGTLRYQLNAAEASAEELQAGWDTRIKTLENDAKTFERKGRPLFELPFDLQGAEGVRQNLRLQAKSYVFLKEFPDGWSSRNFTICWRIRADDTERLDVSFTTTDDSQNASFSYTKDLWFFKFTTGEGAEIKVDHTKWVEMEMRVTNDGDPKDVNKRRCQLFVNGVELKLKGRYTTLNAPLRAFIFNLQLSKHPVLVGGADWWFEEAKK